MRQAKSSQSAQLPLCPAVRSLPEFRTFKQTWESEHSSGTQLAQKRRSRGRLHAPRGQQVLPFAVFQRTPHSKPHSIRVRVATQRFKRTVLSDAIPLCRNHSGPLPKPAPGRKQTCGSEHSPGTQLR